MANWLPWALLGFVAVLLAAMPWRRPHPNHEFVFHMLKLLADEDDQVASPSSIGSSASIEIEATLSSSETDTERHRSSPASYD